MSNTGGDADKTDGAQRSQSAGRPSQEGENLEFAAVIAILVYLSNSERHSDEIFNRTFRLKQHRSNLLPRWTYVTPETHLELEKTIAHGFNRDATSLKGDSREISNDFLQALVKVLLRERPDIIHSALSDYIHRADGKKLEDLAIFAELARATTEHDAAHRDYERQISELEKSRDRYARAKKLLNAAQYKRNQALDPPSTSQDD